MASTFTLSGDLATLGLSNFATKKVRAYVRSNLGKGDALIDSTAGLVMLGDEPVTINPSDGTFTVDLIDTDATDLNVTAGTLRYELVVDYVAGGSLSRVGYSSGWFELTASADISALPLDLPSVTPAWRSAFTAEMEALLAEAEAARDGAVAIVGPVDGTVEALVLNTGGVGPLTSAALSATIGEAIDPLQAELDAAHATYARIQGNSIIPAGDSLSSFDYAPNIPNWAKVAAAASNGRATVLRSAGVSGNLAGQLLARIQADVIAHNPALVTVLVGTNDVPGTDDATYQANITGIHDALRAAGIPSVVCTIPPRNDGGAPYLATIAKWNAWLRDFAFTTNRPLFDFHAQVADEATGELADLYSHDDVHLSASGNAVLGEYVAGLVPSLLPPYETLRPSSNVEPGNLVSNGLLLNSSGGIPTGYTPAGGATAVVETLVTNDTDFKGNAWEWVFTGTDTPFRQLQTLLGSGWAVGDTLRFQVRVKVISQTGLAQGDGVTLPIICDGAGGAAVQGIITGIQGAEGLWHADIVIPAGTTNIYFQPACVASTGQTITARIGELAAFNLTTLGIA